MGRTLKMGFAMGGGVSLGSFSGAGLSEAIKQAVLNAGYDDNGVFRQYDDVIVDVFSGASAGSMSLAIMLRGLCHQTDEEIDRAKANLAAEGINLNNYDATKREQIIAAQVVQDLQRQIWVKEINLDKLLGTTANDKAALTFDGGIIRRGALEKIAHDYFQLDQAYASSFSRKRVLGDEVLFASTLSNLTGIVYDTRGTDNHNPNFVGTRDPYTSSSHKELRIFHLLFDKIDTNEIESNPENYPSKWIRYHLGPKTSGYVSDLRTSTAWSRMVATALACGAFPFAFEPVALERFEFEFGGDCWPLSLTPEICKLAMDSDEPQVEGHRSFPFCYVDGGAFNNEPVREAFRLAAFLDAEDTSDFDRVIVFVDPSVGDEKMDFKLPFLKKFSLREPRRILGSLDGYDVIENSTLDRLLPHIGTLVTMITDEGRVKESNKMMQVSKLFNRKEDYYRAIEGLVNDATDVEKAIKNVLIPMHPILKTRQISEIVPSGALTLKGELIRVCKDKKSDLYSLMAYHDKFEKEETLKDIPDQKLLLKALLRIFMDQLMDLSGKNQDYKIIAIAPEELVNGTYVGIDLPGSPIQAFSGFASERANEFSIDLAIYCTRQLMRELGMMKKDFDLGKKPEWTDDDKKKFVESFKGKLTDINERIDGLFHNSNFIDIFFGVDRLILTQLSKLIKDYLADSDLNPPERYSFRFMIEVNDKSMEIDGSGRFNDAAPFNIDGKLFLVTELYYYPNKYEGWYWNGVHAQEDKLVIDHDGFSVLPDRSFCTIALPSGKIVDNANLMPSGIFIHRKLNSHDSGKGLGTEGWSIKPGVNLVERNILA